MSPDIRVRGGAVAEDVAAILAVLSTLDRRDGDDPRRRWRAGRRRALLAADRTMEVFPRR